MRLSPEVERLLPGEEDVAFYEEHGYYVTPKVLPDDVIDAAIRGAERHWAGERDWRLPVSSGFGDWKPGDGDTIRNSEYTALQNREIRALVQHPIIGAIAGRLTRSSEIRLWDDQLVSKPPSAGPRGPVVGWHTDRAYWMTCTSEDMLTAWIPLHDCPVEMGPVIYVDGSHRWPHTESMRTFNSQDLETLGRRLIGDEDKSLKRVIALRKGQMSFPLPHDPRERRQPRRPAAHVHRAAPAGRQEPLSHVPERAGGAMAHHERRPLPEGR